jgi:hypothetical protein
MKGIKSKINFSDFTFDFLFNQSISNAKRKPLFLSTVNYRFRI